MVSLLDLVERPGFEPWPGHLCFVLGQDRLLSQGLSPPRSTNGYQQTDRNTWRNARGLPAMD